jgi:disulfide bond formation protein DsbB
MLYDAGFTEAKFHVWTGYRTSSCTEGGLVTARKPVAGEVRTRPATAVPAASSSSPGDVPMWSVLLPLLVAVVALAGSLWLSVGMKLKACPLCFYQRTFVMGVVAVLGVGVLTGRRYRGVLNVLALPLSVAGFGVALFHEYLELTGKLECPAGVMGIGTSPQQSLAALAVLLVLVSVGVIRGINVGESRWPVAAGAVLLGLLLAWSAVISSPPSPPAPTKAYETPLDICRPPFRSP